MSAEELRASRARIAASARDERRDLERAVHDGLQQDLIALSVRLQLLRQEVETDAAAALELVDELQRQARETLERARALASRIYPPLLDARGLVDALRASGARLVTDGLGRYPADVEAAVYFCCRALLESAGASGDATIRLREVGEAMHVELDAAADPDLTSVRDQVEASGGVLTAEPSAGGGTRVAATIPLRQSAAAR